MYFLTFNDPFNGVYLSQVIDVCRFLENELGEKTKLISSVSLRNYFKERKQLKNYYPGAIVIPAFPGNDNWKLNIFMLRFVMLFHPKDKVIARGVIATLLALRCKKFSKVCYDARAAVAAEWNEYLYSHSPALALKMEAMEKEALTKSDFRISVSFKLTEYWKEKYQFSNPGAVIIPCTLNSTVLSYSYENAETKRKEMGVKESEILLVFSGSSAGWQSLAELSQYLTPYFKSNKAIKLLLLTKPVADNKLLQSFPDRVIQKWVNQEEVNGFLMAADYGLLHREATVTNIVSSPVKFAEYLAAGLPVLISECVGDYSDFVNTHSCGMRFGSLDWNTIKRPSPDEKLKIQDIAKNYFRKEVYKEEYKRVLNM
jgi:hypothetical protein